MPISMLVSECPIASEGGNEQSRSPLTDPAPAPVPARRVAPVVAMVGGLVVLARAATILAGASPGRGAALAADPYAITLSTRDVAVVTQVYEPGQSSGWHDHPGVHAVAVLSGALTVYDRDCRRQTFVPGRPYVGGQQPHLVRNEDDAPVTMIVTYLNPSAPTNSTEHVAGPAGCQVG